MDKSEKSTSSTSSYLNPNRLYPRPYTRSSTSRESTVSPASSTSNLPRLSATKRDAAPSRSTSKEALTSKYKSSREDLSSGSQNKYLNSRFLPKNSVERSYTAYTRPSNIRTHEVSRKNKELLNALHVQQEQERNPSRASSVTPEVVPITKPKEPSPVKQLEMETVKVCTRGTSPNLTTPTPPTFLRTRRIEFAKTIEKTVTRPKTVAENMVDKEIQSDRLDDSTRSSRFAGASRISATPWTNILDMKFTSPSNKKVTKQDSADSPKSLSRASSTKSLASVKSEKNSKKSKLTPPKPVGDKKQLPPIPKSESKPSSLHSLNTPNKDFRKSVLNMNPDGTRKKLGRRSNSASSAESDNADPDATDISENLTTCSYHSKVFQTRRSPSSDVSTSEEESRSRKETTEVSSSILGSGDETISEKPPSRIPQNKSTGKNEADAKNFLMRALAPVTNLFKANKQSDSDKISSDTGDGKVAWILDPSSEEQSQPRSAKLVLHRVETDEHSWWGDETSSEQLKSEPVNMKYGEYKEEPKIYSGYNAENNMTGGPKEPRIKTVESGEAPWWLDEHGQPPEGIQTEKPAIKHVQSGEQPWWLQDNPAEVPEGVQVYPVLQKPKIKPVESGEAPWWLNQDSTPPEGVQTYPNWTEPSKSVRRNDSGNSTWWLDSDKSNSEAYRPAECVESHKIRHIDSGEREWWVNDDEASSKEDPKPKYTIRHQESGERAWWMQDQEPLGDRASPEGLEMPKDNEGRLSPYDNVPNLRDGVKNEVPPLFISKHTNIDDILGGTGQLWSPVMNKIFGYTDGDECREVDAREVIIHEGGATRR